MNKGVLYRKISGVGKQHQLIWEQAREAADAVVKLYASFNLSPLRGNTELHRLFNDTEAFIFDKITGGELVIGGMRINSQEAIKLIEKPAGYEDLLQEVKQYREDVIGGTFSHQNYKVIFQLNEILLFFSINDTGQVVISEKKQGELEEMGKYYATTPLQIALVKFIGSVSEAYFNHGLNEHLKDIKTDDHIVKVLAATLEKLDLDNQVPVISINLSRLDLDGVKHVANLHL